LSISSYVELLNVSSIQYKLILTEASIINDEDKKSYLCLY